jgi:hypothetical protein
MTVFAAAPVNSGIAPVPVGLPIMPDPDMLMMLGLVSLLPAAQDGTATAERVTITSAGMADGQPGLTVRVDVTAGASLKFVLVG